MKEREEKREMYETRDEYEGVVKRQVVFLEWALGRTIRHGEVARCPRCGMKGCFDLDGLGFAPDCNSIYYSTVFNEWRCRVCDYLMCA
jgi:hypothetical protein